VITEAAISLFIDAFPLFGFSKMRRVGEACLKGNRNTTLPAQ
jgi:hypothetical protein